MKKLIKFYYEKYQENKNHSTAKKYVQHTFAKKVANNASWGNETMTTAGGVRVESGDFAICFKPTAYELQSKSRDQLDGYRIDCGVFQNDGQNSLMLPLFWNNFTYQFANGGETLAPVQPVTLGPGTPTIDALATVKDSLGADNGLPKDIILLTDGDYRNAAIFSKYNKYSSKIYLIAKEIVNRKIGGKEVGFYPIAYGAGMDVNKLRNDFNGYFTKYYVAGDEQALAENFKEILETVIQKTAVQTDVDSSHSLQFIGEDGKIQEYKQDGVYKIILELKGENKSPITITFDTSGKNVGDVKPLETIYQDGVVKLENTWQQQFGDNPDELDAYNDKTITLFV